MKEGNPYIVLVQRDARLIDMTEKYVKRTMKKNDVCNMLFCTDDAVKALDELRSHSVDILITSHALESSDGKYWDSSILAEKAYHEAPGVMVIRYTASPGLPTDQRNVAADVEKPGTDAGAVISFIASPSLGDILRTQDWDRLKKENPTFRFYDDVLERLRPQVT